MSVTMSKSHERDRAHTAGRSESSELALTLCEQALFEARSAAEHAAAGTTSTYEVGYLRGKAVHDAAAAVMRIVDERAAVQERRTRRSERPSQAPTAADKTPSPTHHRSAGRDGGSCSRRRSATCSRCSPLTPSNR